jgi:hypothetical protein
MQITTKTPSGIKRPAKGEFVRFATARQHARDLNSTKGRGYRALKAADGNGFGVIFRPAVAGNKQRKVREVL